MKCQDKIKERIDVVSQKKKKKIDECVEISGGRKNEIKECSEMLGFGARLRIN